MSAEEPLENLTTKASPILRPSTLCRTHFITQSASVITIAVGSLVLIAWSFDITPFLKNWMPGTVPMKANTAIGFILAGISLLLAESTKQDYKRVKRERGGKLPRRFRHYLSQGLAIAVFLLGLLVVSQYLFGWDLGIDQLLFRDSTVSLTNPYPGRMALNTALNFMLVGTALWLLGAKKPKMAISLSQGLSLVSGFISVLAFVGYLYNVRIFYQFSIHTTSMALPTSVTFGILWLGILLARGDRGLLRPITSDLTGGRIGRRLIPSTIFISLFLGKLVLQGEQAGYYDPAFSLSLLTLLLNVIFIGLIWRDAI